MAEQQPGDQQQPQEVAKEKKPTKRKSSWKAKLFILLILVIILLIPAVFLLQYVKPNEFGVKVVRIGIKRGVHKEIYGPGYHLVLPFGMEEMNRLPKDIQVLELTNHPKTAAKASRVEKAAHIQTSDGFFVDVDVSILYRIVDPYKVFTIASGVFKLNFPLFLLASALSRSLRFFAVAALFRKFGPGIKNFIDKYFNLLAILFFILLFGGFLVIKFLF